MSEPNGKEVTIKYDAGKKKEAGKEKKETTEDNDGAFSSKLTKKRNKSMNPSSKAFEMKLVMFKNRVQKMLASMDIDKITDAERCGKKEVGLAERQAQQKVEKTMTRLTKDNELLKINLSNKEFELAEKNDDLKDYLCSTSIPRSKQKV